MKRTYSHEIAQIIADFLTSGDWHYSFDEERGLFRFGIKLHGKLGRISFVIDVKDDAFIVYAISPIGADEEDLEGMTTMAEFICRANYGLKHGNFELDMRDGEIRFKCFVDCDGILPTDEMVKSNIMIPAFMFERYGDGILDVIFHKAKAKEAVEHSESSEQDRLMRLLRELAHRQASDNDDDGESEGAEGPEPDEDAEVQDPDLPILIDPFAEDDATEE